VPASGGVQILYFGRDRTNRCAVSLGGVIPAKARNAWMMQVICNNGISRYGIAEGPQARLRHPILPLVRLIERKHGAGDLAGFHRAKGFVDVAEPAALGDHAIEVEPALAVEFEIGRDVGAELV
jgi:hypothetical protein